MDERAIPPPSGITLPFHVHPMVTSFSIQSCYREREHAVNNSRLISCSPSIVVAVSALRFAEGAANNAEVIRTFSGFGEGLLKVLSFPEKHVGTVHSRFSDSLFFCRIVPLGSSVLAQ